MALTGDLYDAVVRIVEDRVKEVKVSREFYDRLIETVSSLADAQKQTQEQLDRLVEAQKRTEERLDRLADAQKRTEEQVEKLSATVAGLVEAQVRTEVSITKLTEAMTEMRKGIAGLGETIGFGLEDIAHVVLPGWLERNQKVRIEALERRTLTVGDKQLEFDLYGEGSKGRTLMLILGEVKSRIHPSDVEEFAKRLEDAAPVISRKILALMFGYWVHPAASAVAKRLGIRVVASYER